MSKISDNKKRLNIGLRQAPLLCQMPYEKLLAFLADGLPIILASAQGYWHASKQLKDMPREAGVLRGLSEEEAAKILILMDAVRCPSKLRSSKMGEIVKWFYDHRTRLIYAAAATWSANDIKQLRDYVDTGRKSHELEGNFGEFIVPNLIDFDRESLLYVDIVSNEDGEIEWNTPEFVAPIILEYVPMSLMVAEAMAAVGIFTLQGLKAVSEIWGQMNFANTENYGDTIQLTKKLLERLANENLMGETTAMQKHINLLFDNWQLPMYDFDFKTISVYFDELNEKRERMLWAEIGEIY